MSSFLSEFKRLTDLFKGDSSDQLCQELATSRAQANDTRVETSQMKEEIALVNNAIEFSRHQTDLSSIIPIPAATIDNVLSWVRIQTDREAILADKEAADLFEKAKHLRGIAAERREEATHMGHLATNAVQKGVELVEGKYHNTSNRADQAHGEAVEVYKNEAQAYWEQSMMYGDLYRAYDVAVGAYADEAQTHENRAQAYEDMAKRLKEKVAAFNEGKRLNHHADESSPDSEAL